MSRLSQQARVNKLFEAINKEPDSDVQTIDCSNAKTALLARLQEGGNLDLSTPVTLDQDMVTGLKKALQAQIKQSEEAYNVRYVSKK